MTNTFNKSDINNKPDGLDDIEAGHDDSLEDDLLLNEKNKNDIPSDFLVEDSSNGVLVFFKSLNKIQIITLSIGIPVVLVVAYMQYTNYDNDDLAALDMFPEENNEQTSIVSPSVIGMDETELVSGLTQPFNEQALMSESERINQALQEVEPFTLESQLAVDVEQVDKTIVDEKQETIDKQHKKLSELNKQLAEINSEVVALKKQVQRYKYNSIRRKPKISTNNWKSDYRIGESEPLNAADNSVENDIQPEYERFNDYVLLQPGDGLAVVMDRECNKRVVLKGDQLNGFGLIKLITSNAIYSQFKFISKDMFSECLI